MNIQPAPERLVPQLTHCSFCGAEDVTVVATEHPAAGIIAICLECARVATELIEAGKSTGEPKP